MLHDSLSLSLPHSLGSPVSLLLGFSNRPSILTLNSIALPLSSFQFFEHFFTTSPTGSEVSERGTVSRPSYTDLKPVCSKLEASISPQISLSSTYERALKYPWLYPERRAQSTVGHKSPNGNPFLTMDTPIHPNPFVGDIDKMQDWRVVDKISCLYYKGYQVTKWKRTLRPGSGKRRCWGQPKRREECVVDLELEN